MAELSNVQIARRKVRLFSWSGALLLGGIIISINFIASYVPVRWDTSDGKAYSISSSSKEILKRLDDTLVVKLVFSSQLPPPYKFNEQFAADLLSEYKRASHGKIRLEYLDPASVPKGREEAAGYGVSPVQMDVRERDRREVKECFMGIAFLYGDRRESIAVLQDTQNLEYEISARIKKLLNPNKPAIGLIKNGGSLTAASSAIEPLVGPLNQLYHVREIDLVTPVPPEISAVWILAPSKPFEKNELANLRTYMNSGGALGILMDRNAIKLEEFRASPQQLGLDEFLDEWGVKMNDGLVVDPRADRIQIQAVQGQFRMINVVDYPYFPYVSDLDRAHPATKSLDGVTFPFVSPIEVKTRLDGFTYTTLAQSSPLSYLDERPMMMSPLQQTRRPENAKPGPFPLAMLVEGPYHSQLASISMAEKHPQMKPGRLILIGTSHFIDSAFPPRPSNYSFFVNLMDWSVQDNDLIQIRSKGFARRPLREIADPIRLFFKYAMMVVLPLGVVLIGLFVWRRQKIRRALLPLEYPAS